MYEFIKVIDDIKAVKELYPEIEEDKFNELIKLDPTFVDGRNSVGTYGKWILNLYKKGNLKEEDFYKVPNYLKEFEKKKKLIQNKDINTYKTLGDLAKVLDETNDPTQSKNQLRKAVKRTDLDNDAEFIGDFGKYVCYSPKTYEASCKLGANTHWCTATRESSGYYEHYSKKGKLYIFIDKSTGQAEYQFHFETQSFMDKNDNEISVGEFISENPEVEPFIVQKIKENFDDYDIEFIIENFGKASVQFIDQIKETYESLGSGWKKDNMIDVIMRNPFLIPYFKEDIDVAIKEDTNVVRNFLFNKEYREKYKDYFIKYFDIKNSKVEIGNDILAYYLYRYSRSHNRRENLSEDFLRDCLSGDIYDQFNFDYDVNANDGENYLNKENENLLKTLHLDYKNISSDNRYNAIIQAREAGTINDCLNDFQKELDYACHGSFRGVKLNFDLKFLDENTHYIEMNIDTYFQLLDNFQGIIDLSTTNEFDDEVSISPSELISYMIADNFDFTEPYYGWNDFDEDVFNDIIYDTLTDIQSGEIEPEFDDEEDEEEWHKWFDGNYEVGIKPAEGQQEMKFDSKEYLSKEVKDKDLNYVYKRGFVYKDKDGKLQRKDKSDIREYYENLEGRFTKSQIYYMVEGADIDCDRYIELHKNDKEVEEWKPKKYKDMSKQEYINYLINAGYSDVDAQDKADALYGEDSDD